MLIRLLHKGQQFRDNIKGEVRWTTVQTVTPCPTIPRKTHINAHDCWDSDYPVEVQGA